MFVFFISAVILVVLALVFVLPALLRTPTASQAIQDEQNIAIARERLALLNSDLENNTVTRAEYDQAKHELEQTLASDLSLAQSASSASRQNPLWTVVIALCVPVLATGLYLAVGAPATITGPLPQQQAHATPSTPSPSSSTQADPSQQQVASVEAMVGNLAQRLEQNPDDAEGWMMLARSYTVMGRHDDAISAYKTLHELVGDEPGVLAQYAGALIIANRGQANPQAQDFLQRALASNPNEARALWLSGMVAQQQGNADDALRLWRHLEGILEPGSEPLNNLRQMIAQVEQETAGATATTPVQSQPATPAQTPSDTQAQTPAQTPTSISGAMQGADTTSTASSAVASSAASITVKVVLSEALSEQAAPDDIVFIFARATQGPPMPLAVVRKQVKDLPVQVTLDDSMAMMPQMRLSQFEQVNVGARISKTGNALPQSGDLQGLIGPVTVAANHTIHVTIDEIVP